MLHTYEDLLAYLRRENAAFAEVRAHHAVELTTYAPPVEGALVILWNPDPQLVQFIHPLPFPVPPERTSAVESTIVRLNHALALPGFGFNHATSSVYYRLVLPRNSDGSMAESEVQRAVTTVITTVRDLWNSWKAVIQDRAPPESILAVADPKRDP